MTRRAMVAISMGCALIAGAVLLPAVSHVRDQRRLREQLRLARADGIPTTGEEYAALIPHASPGENAAPLYRTFPKLGEEDAKRLAGCDENLLIAATPEHIEAAKQYLAKLERQLKTAEAAAQLPRCWFDRPWAKGPGVLFSEYPNIKAAAKALAFRGSVEAATGDVDGAIADIERIVVLAKHAGEEPHVISRLVRDNIFVIAANHLAAWYFAHPHEHRYGEALAKVLDSMPQPDLASEYADQLYNTLWVIDHASTPEGRKEIGIHEDDIEFFPRLKEMLASSDAVKAAVTSAMRRRLAALKLQPAQRDPILARTQREIEDALEATPTAALIIRQFGGLEVGTDRLPNFLSGQLRYRIFLRAMEQGHPPKLDLSEFVDPSTGGNPTYTFDGRRIKIEAGGRTLQIPPLPKDAQPSPVR